MIAVEIKSFPMPPSANELYFEPAKGRRAKTMQYKKYEGLVQFWMYKNGYQIQNARLIMQKRTNDEAFHIETNFYFLKNKILTKNNTPKKNDTSNRIKALHDVLSQVLGIDDCLFFDGSFSKRISQSEQLGDFVDIKITTIAIEI